MPSAKILEQKQQQVSALKDKFTSCAAGVLVDYKGINVEQDTKLRKELREAGVEYSVVKNSLLRFAVDGTDFADMKEVLVGTTAIAFSGEDPLAPAKILNKYAEDSKGAFSIKSGYFDGKLVSAQEVTQLANIPGREQLLSMLCSALQGNIRGLAVALNAVATNAAE
ncbi:50S ribosomal protein L10 [Ruminococcaceae bacterium OttesenSCG-928-N02]|nr:50S ribosomal protein L10 [Ruminococcaceae bacterium OttesenSCG-928-N02]